MRNCKGAIAALVFSVAVFGCGKKETATTTATTGSTAKPATTSASVMPGSTTSTASGSAKQSAKSPKADNEKKGVPSDKKAAVPTDWVTFSDTNKGYEFQVPASNSSKDYTVGQVAVFEVEVKQPQLHVMQASYKDKTLTRENLVEDAKDMLEMMGDKDVMTGKLEPLGDDYGLAVFTSTSKDGSKLQGKILVATDVTDNYVTIITSDAKSYPANEKTIDAIWGSFAMYSGGASGTN